MKVTFIQYDTMMMIGRFVMLKLLSLNLEGNPTPQKIAVELIER